VRQRNTIEHRAFDCIDPDLRSHVTGLHFDVVRQLALTGITREQAFVVNAEFRLHNAE
jgi:hypothetical protein